MALLVPARRHPKEKRNEGCEAESIKSIHASMATLLKPGNARR
jgi:hypothetical protein